MDDILNAVSSASRFQSSFKEHPYLGSCGTKRCFQEDTTNDNEAKRLRYPDGSKHPPTLLSSFETSPHFFPETYTMGQNFPPSSFLVISSHEGYSSGDSRMCCYKAFFLKAPRQWCRMSVSIKLDQSSKYWAATNMSAEAYNTGESINKVGSAALPYSLLSQLQKALLQIKICDEEPKFMYDSKTREIRRLKSGESQANSPFEPIEPGSNEAILVALDDLGCRRYFENEVTQLEVIDPPSRFASYVNGMLVCETSFARSTPSSSLLYSIKILHSMKGLPGFANLIGVVVDTTGRYLRSYLIEFPRARWILAEACQIQGISWERREKWGRQLVEILKQLHSKGFTAGTILGFRSSILIDVSDNVLLCWFQEKFRMGYSLGCYYPPEFRHFRDMSKSVSEANSPKVTTKTDLFHLGMVLWLLAENVPQTHNSPLCIRNRCSATSSTCDVSHEDPIALPTLSNEIPQYFRNIIDECRAPNPKDRPAAWRLLYRFPPIEPRLLIKTPMPESSKHDSTINYDLLSGGVACDGCRTRNMQFSFWHCNTCNTGDFYICQACYDVGVHCVDEDHLLVEMKKMGGMIVPARYSSSVKNDGKRNVFEI